MSDIEPLEQPLPLFYCQSHTLVIARALFARHRLGAYERVPMLIKRAELVEQRLRRAAAALEAALERGESGVAP